MTMLPQLQTVDVYGPLFRQKRYRRYTRVCVTHKALADIL